MRLCHLLLALPLFLTACGGGSDPKTLVDEGSKALAAEKFADARSSFQGAVDAIGDDSSNSLFERAHMGLIKATIESDATKAKAMLLDFQKAHGDMLSADEFVDMAGRFGSQGAFAEGVALLSEGKTLYSDETATAKLDKLGELLATQAKKAGDAAALSSLAGLGYVGD